MTRDLPHYSTLSIPNCIFLMETLLPWTLGLSDSFSHYVARQINKLSSDNSDEGILTSTSWFLDPQIPVQYIDCWLKGFPYFVVLPQTLQSSVFQLASETGAYDKSDDLYESEPTVELPLLSQVFPWSEAVLYGMKW